jgi:hypothetical protein
VAWYIYTFSTRPPLPPYPLLTKIFPVSVPCLSRTCLPCLRYPKGSPLLSVAALQYLSKLLNIVSVPALSAASLGTSLTLPALGRYWLLIPCCLCINSISYCLAWTVGRVLHERGDPQLYQASVVAVGTPNALALPIIILGKTLSR